MKNNVEKLRHEYGVTQERLAEDLSVSRQTIISIEKGRYNPSLELAFKIGEYFDLSLEEIFIYKEDSQ